MKAWEVLKQLRERRVAQFFLMYCAGGWLVLQAVAQVADRGVVPEVVYRVALTLVLCSIPGALVVSWFHGEKGNQSIPTLEVWLLGAVSAFALGASGLVIRTGLAGDGPGDAMAPWEDPTRVAVLYFEARGGGEDAEFLAAGLTEGLIDELSSVDALHVVSRNGSQLFRGSAAPPDSVARVLGVGTLVSGLVMVAGDRVRVETAMVESRSGRQLESLRVEHPRAELFELQDELAQRVSLFLREKIGVEVGQLEARRGTEVVAAWELLQQAEQTATGANELLDAEDVRGAAARLREADALLERVEALDPGWTHPVTRRGWLAYDRARLEGLERGPQDRLTREALGHAERVLARAPGDPDARDLRATVLYWRYLLNFTGAEVLDEVEADLRAVIAERPRGASAWATLSHLLNHKGDFPQAKLAALRAYEADPFVRNVHEALHFLAGTSWDLGEHRDAVRWCDEGLARFPDDYRFRECQLKLFGLKEHEPDVPAAWERYRELVERAPPQRREFIAKDGLMYVAWALVRADLPDSARAVARRARASSEVDPLRELAYKEAAARTWLGDYDEASELLGLFISANPGYMEAFRSAAESGEMPWFLIDILDQPSFRELVGLR